MQISKRYIQIKSLHVYVQCEGVYTSATLSSVSVNNADLEVRKIKKKSLYLTFFSTGSSHSMVFFNVIDAFLVIVLNISFTTCCKR